MDPRNPAHTDLCSHARIGRRSALDSTARRWHSHFAWATDDASYTRTRGTRFNLSPRF